MQPLPWSFTALEDFINCPFSYYHKRVLKSVKEERGEAQIWGEEVHKAFELRQGPQRQPLPAALSPHEPYMRQLDAADGVVQVERRVALNLHLAPTGFFSPDVWYRGVLDWQALNPDLNYAKVVDYKTGKPHTKDKQLKLFSLTVMHEYPWVQQVDTEYYWTQTRTVTTKTYTRDQLHEMWSAFVPDLRQYIEAFKTDTWQKRTSGLCNGWCPVQQCPNWRPKRQFR